MTVDDVKVWFTSFNPFLERLRPMLLPFLIRYLVSVILVVMVMYLFMGHDELPTRGEGYG